MDTEVVIAPTETSTNEPVLTPEQIAWKQQMDYQFNTEPPTQATHQAEIPDTTIVNDAPLVTAPDYTPFIKEFGVENVDEFRSQWQQLQDLKANPPKPKEFEFINEESKKLNELIRTGKFKEANTILTHQLEIEELSTADVTEETADKIIKLGLQFENKDLTPEEVNFKFKKMFAIPKEPVMMVTEDETEFEARMNEWKEQVLDIKMSKSIEAKMMKPKLVAAKSTIQFPDIEATQPVTDADYEAYKASKANVLEQATNELIPAIKSLKEGDVVLGFKVNDANNQMEFDIALSPTQEAFEKARQDSLSFDTWIHNVCYDETGKFHPERIQKLILLYDNYDNYVQSIARQAVNAERKKTVNDNTVNANNGGRNYNISAGERTEFQKQMDSRLS